MLIWRFAATSCFSRAGEGIRVKSTNPGGQGRRASGAGGEGPPDPGRDQLQSDAVQHVPVMVEARPALTAGIFKELNGFQVKQVINGRFYNNWHTCKLASLPYFNHFSRFFCQTLFLSNAKGERMPITHLSYKRCYNLYLRLNRE